MTMKIGLGGNFPVALSLAHPFHDAVVGRFLSLLSASFEGMHDTRSKKKGLDVTIMAVLFCTIKAFAS